MAKIEWDNITKRPFKYGISNGVLYKFNNEYFTNGVAWNGLISVTDKPSGKEKTPLYSGNVLKGYELSLEEYGGEIKALMYPDEFMPCFGHKELIQGIYYTQQEPELFGLSYQVTMDDAMHQFHRPEIHLIYNCMIVDNVSFTHETYGSKQYEEMVFPFVSFPVETFRFRKPLSHIVIRAGRLSSDYDDKYRELLDMLYGTGTNKKTGIPRMPKPSELITMFTEEMPSASAQVSSRLMPTRKDNLMIPDLPEIIT